MNKNATKNLRSAEMEKDRDYVVERFRRKVAETTNRNLLDRVAEALAFAQDRHDTVDGPDGKPLPNDWMRLTNILEGRVA